MTFLLSELREPPVVGVFYLVPAVQFNWCGAEAVWPVLGPMHKDAEFFNFDSAHYHVDARFVSKRLAKRVEWYGENVAQIAQRYPLSKWRYDDRDLPKGRPSLRRMKCQSAGFPYHFHHQAPVADLRAAYGDLGPSTSAKPIRLADGRALCPHRKVDLSSFLPDVDGVVTCPLHGLRVCMKELAA